MDKKFKIFVIAAISLLTISIIAGIILVVTILPANKKAQAPTPSSKTVDLTEVAMGDAIMTNLTMESDGLQHYAKVKISLGMDATDSKGYKALSEELVKKSSSIRDEIIDTVGEQTFTMLSNPTTGKDKLGDEIISRLNTLLQTKLIKAVYFQEYFVQ